jgi:predicted DNA-binding transcriptional regulator YafY
MNIIQTIISCGSKKEMVYITYEGEERLVEPYSFRNGNTLFFAWCQLRNEIRSFRLSKITNARHSGIYYAPRFPVEF